MNLKKIIKYLLFLVYIFIFIGYTTVFTRFNQIGLGYIYKLFTLVTYLSIYLILLYYINYFRFKRYNICFRNRIFFIFLIIIATTSFVVSSNKLDTIKYIWDLFGIIIMSCFFIEKISFKKCIEGITIAHFIVIVITLFVIEKFPHIGYSLDYSSGKMVWSGTFATKNNLGAEMCFGALTAYYLLINNKKIINRFFYLLVMIISLYILFNCGSITPIIIFIAAIIIFYIYKILLKRLNINLIILLSLMQCMVYIFLKIGNQYSDFFYKIFKRNLTLTGRTDIWSAIYKVFIENPIFGWGYGTFWGYENYYEQKAIELTGFNYVGAHNGFLDLLLQIGLVGTIVFLFILINTGYQMKKISNSNFFETEMNYIYLYFIYFFIFTISERSLGSMSYQTLMIFLCCIKINDIYRSKKIE